jgi:DNA mismatch repair protein MSH6
LKASFDAEIAKKTGKIIPELGVNEDYDAAIDEIKSVQKQLDTYLKEQSKKLKCVSERAYLYFFI